MISNTFTRRKKNFVLWLSIYHIQAFLLLLLLLLFIGKIQSHARFESKWPMNEVTFRSAGRSNMFSQQEAPESKCISEQVVSKKFRTDKCTFIFLLQMVYRQFQVKQEQKFWSETKCLTLNLLELSQFPQVFSFIYDLSYIYYGKFSGALFYESMENYLIRLLNATYGQHTVNIRSIYGQYKSLLVSSSVNSQTQNTAFNHTLREMICGLIL